MMTARFQHRSLVLAVAVALAAAPSLAAEEIADIVKKVRQSLVIVRGPGGMGPGVIVDGQGHVATAAHYTHGALRVEVEIDGTRVPAEILTRQTLADLALLKVDPPPAAGRAAHLADSDGVELGQRAIIVGTPQGGPLILAVGYITGRRTANIIHGGLARAELFETDAATRPELAGSPMFDVKGDMIGIVTGISSQASNSAGYGYAVGASTIQRLLADPPPWTGVEALYISGEMAALLNLPQPAGLLIQYVVPGSQAERFGLHGGAVTAVIGGEQVTLGGDIILELAGISFSAPDAGPRIARALHELKPGDKVKAVILRRGQRVDLTTQVPPK